jgi:hypothetical protein
MGGTGHFIAMWAMILACLATGRPALAQEPGSPLQRKVAATIARDLQFGGANQSSQLKILAPAAMSLSARSELHVVWVRPGFSPGSWLVRMDCAARSDCLPFYVVLRAAEPGLRQAAPDPLSTASQPRNSSAGVRQVNTPLAHSGDHMLLVEARPGMRLQARVVCLQSGGLGDAIRVRNLATHRVLLATVTGKDEMRVE